MSNKHILIIFLLFTFIDCGSNKTNNDFIDSLIKENSIFYKTYLTIFVTSFILAGLMIFTFKIKKKNQIIIIDTTDNSNLPIQTDNNLGLENPQNLQEKIENPEIINADTEREIVKTQNIPNNKIIINKLKKETFKRKIIKNYFNKGEKIWYNLSLICRIIFTLLSLEALFFIYNMIVQDILIFPGILYDMENLMWIFFYILYVIFIWYASKLIIIPTYEFINFPFLKYYNPFCHLNSFRYLINGIEYKEIEKEDLKNKNILRINQILAFCGGLFSLLFISTFAFESLIKFKDYMEFFFLIFIYIYYISIIFCYLIFFIYYYFKNYFLYFIKNKSIKNKLINESDNYPNLNLVYYNIYPHSDKNYEPENNESKNECYSSSAYKCENLIYLIRFGLKLFLLTFSIIASIYFSSYNQKFYKFFFSLNIIIIALSLSIGFPICFANKKFCRKGKYKKEVNNLSLLISRVISFIIFLICFLAFFFISLKKEYENDDEIYSKIKKINTSSIKRVDYHRNKTMHSFCFSSIHNIPTYLFIPFINDAYYSEENKTTLDYENYTKLFYNDDYEIEKIGNLINNTKRGGKKMSKMIQYKVKNKRNEITILAIKGTSFRRDIYLDMQLYFPAILLNLINTFSTLDQQKENMTFSFEEYGFSIPYRILFEYFIVDQYLNDLIDAFENNNFTEKVVIVGHSLGGGLAKILGKYKSKQALSLSGPGMNTFHSLWKYEGTSEYFDLTSIDIVPDLDLVPRVDISGGTVYRLLCLNTTLNCHSKELSLCESMIMCRNPNAKEYCINIAKISDNDYEMLFNATEFNILPKKKKFLE